MSCPSEATCLLYVEDELEADPRRELEGHLVGCRTCRERVLALREEGRLLGAVLRGGAEPKRQAAPSAARAPVAWGVPAAIAAVTAALAVASALLESRLPGALDLLHPRRLKGVSEMAFDLIFALRESAPGLIELALAVGGVASFSALLCFAVSALGRRWVGGAAALVLAAGVAAPEAAGAFALHRDEDLRIEAGERVSETVLATGDRVDVDGVIDGDLIVAAERVSVRGEVTGSLYVFTRDLELTGRVGGAVHTISERTRIEGQVGGPVYAFTESLVVARSGRLRGDLNAVADSAEIDGVVGRDLHVAGDALELRGRVNRDVHAHGLEALALRDGAEVRGDVEATLEEGREVDRSPGAKIAGDLRVEPRQKRHEHYLSHYRSWKFYAVHLLAFAAAFVFGLALHWLWPGLFGGEIATGGDLGRTLALGFIALAATPLAIVAVALTLVGLPLAVALLFLFVAALYTADLAVAAWIGRLVSPPGDASTTAFGQSLAIGLALLTAATMVPFLGLAVGAVAMLIGLGLLAARARDAVSARSAV